MFVVFKSFASAQMPHEKTTCIGQCIWYILSHEPGFHPETEMGSGLVKEKKFLNCNSGPEMTS